MSWFHLLRKEKGCQLVPFSCFFAPPKLPTHKVVQTQTCSSSFLLYPCNSSQSQINPFFTGKPLPSFSNLTTASFHRPKRHVAIHFLPWRMPFIMFLRKTHVANITFTIKHFLNYHNYNQNLCSRFYKNLEIYICLRIKKFP